MISDQVVLPDEHGRQRGDLVVDSAAVMVRGEWIVGVERGVDVQRRVAELRGEDRVRRSELG